MAEFINVDNLTYTGTMQELVTAKTVEGGKMVFSFDKED